MMRALFSAVSGIKTHQTRMDVIGNNIANVNTVAYKSQAVTFKDVYYQTTQTATGPNADSGKGGVNPKQIGLGSSVGAISTAMTQGPNERTDNPWDLCISGDAFFVVSSGGNTYFTRSGDFKPDLSGALVTQGGANVMGWKADENGNIVKDKVQPLYVMSPEYMFTAPAKTTDVTITGNVDARTTESSVFTVNFFDSLGNEYQASLTLKYEGINGQNVEYSISEGTVTKNGEKTNIILDTAASPRLLFDKTTGASAMSNANLDLSFIYDGDSTGDLENIGTGGAQSSTISLDASGLTMYASATDIKYSKGRTDELTGNVVGAGKAVGTMTAVGINEAGGVVASYSNGDTKIIGQIAVTTFANPTGLEKVGENLYAATLNSGSFDGIGKDISETGGKVVSGYLEMSNVDLADQFTTMITTQRGYQANSRIITVSDSLLEELINLKR